MANLILWRHAEAEAESVSGADADRALTKRGRKDAARMAKSAFASQYPIFMQFGAPLLGNCCCLAAFKSSRVTGC